MRPQLWPGLPSILIAGLAGEAGEIASGEFAVLRKLVAASTLLDRLSKLSRR